MSVPTALHSRASDEWWTPPEVFDPLHAEFGFTLDVCAGSAEASRTTCYASPAVDGLTVAWTQPIDRRGTDAGPKWCNPPYSTVAKWIEKAWLECYGNGVTSVLLINNITETDAWAKYIMGEHPEYPHGAAEVRFVKGRVYFIAGCDMYDKSGKLTMRKGERGPAPKGSAIVVFRPGHTGPPKFSVFHQDAVLKKRRAS